MRTSRTASASFLASVVSLGALALGTGCSHNGGNASAKSASVDESMSSQTQLTAGELPGKSTKPVALPAQVGTDDAPSTMASQPPRESGQMRLLVSKDIVERCPNVRALQNKRMTGAPEKVWLTILSSVADCQTGGRLGTARLEVSGEARAATMIGFALARLGVDLSRLDAVDDFAEDLCIRDASCPVSTVKIELADPPVDSDTHI